MPEPIPRTLSAGDKGKLTQARQVALLRKWTKGATLKADELAEIAHLLPVAAKAQAQDTAGPVRQIDLARRWGVSKMRICQLVKRGMPLTSAADAENWRTANSKSGWGHMASGKAPVNISAAQMGKVAKDLLDSQQAEDDSDENHAVRAKRVERQIYRLLELATREAAGNLAASGALPGLIRTHAQANSNRLDAEVRWEKHRLALGEVAPVAELNAVLDAALDPLASQLRNFPRNVAPAANPADPAGAERAIAAALGPILEQVAAALERAPLAVAPAHAA